MAETLHLGLLANAHDFVNESLRNLGRAAEAEGKQLKFAVIHLAQAVELLLKERLKREHPLLVYRKVERGRQTVTVEEAIRRLERCDVHLPEADVKRITAARDVRNDLMHFEALVTHGQLFGAYVDLLEFAYVFHQRELGTELHEAVEEELHQIETMAISFFGRDLVTFQGEEVVKTWPMELVKAQSLQKFAIDGVLYDRIRYGARGDLLEQGAAQDRACHDCAARPGQFHAFACDSECCPRCGGQWLICDCEDEIAGDQTKLDISEAAEG